MDFQKVAVQVQQIVTGPNAPKGDWATVPAIILSVLDILPQVAGAVAACLAIVWWVLRIRYERQRSRESSELHDKKMGRD